MSISSHVGKKTRGTLEVGFNLPKLNQIFKLVVALTSRRTCAVYRLDAGSVGTVF